MISGIHRNTVSKWVKEVAERGNWLCLDNTVDDATRFLYAAILSDKTDETARDFLEEVVTTSPFLIEAVMTDNGREHKGKLILLPGIIRKKDVVL